MCSESSDNLIDMNSLRYTKHWYLMMSPLTLPTPIASQFAPFVDEEVTSSISFQLCHIL